MKKIYILIVALVVLSSIFAVLRFNASDSVTITRPSLLNNTSLSISDDERNGLIYMREEEKLARDVYTVMYGKYNLKPFKNITGAEQRHMDFIKDLLVKYDIDDPVKSDETGLFTNDELKNLHDKYIEQGNISLIDALKTGAEIEEADIRDLNKQLDLVKSNDIIDTYTYLKNGSENHLRAFVRNLSRRGIEYSPLFLSKDEYDSILKK